MMPDSAFWVQARMYNEYKCAMNSFCITLHDLT
jgi:hypothetical protein